MFDKKKKEEAAPLTLDLYRVSYLVYVNEDSYLDYWKLVHVYDSEEAALVGAATQQFIGKTRIDKQLIKTIHRFDKVKPPSLKGRESGL